MGSQLKDLLRAGIRRAAIIRNAEPPQNEGQTRMSARATTGQVTLFLESRYILDADGHIFAASLREARGGWTSGLESVPNLQLAARMRVGDTSGLYKMPAAGQQLPYYVGGRQLITSFPRLMIRVASITRRSSSVVVKLPGIIGMIAIVFATIQRKPIVAQVVGDIDSVLRSGTAGIAGRLLAPFATWLTRQCVLQADAVRYVTRATLQRKYPASRAALVSPYSDVVIDETMKLRESEPDGSRMVCVGSQENQYKGQQLAIQAVALLAPSFPSLKLTLVGSGRYQVELRDLCKSLGISQKVEFVGHVSSPENLVDILDASTLFVLPSLTEGLPRALIEAMSRGLPCIGSSVGGVPELLSAEYCFEPNQPDQIAALAGQLLASPALRKEAGAKNLEAVRAYSTENQLIALRRWQQNATQVLVPEAQI